MVVVGLFPPVRLPHGTCAVFSVPTFQVVGPLCLDVWMAVIENPGDKLARGETGEQSDEAYVI